MSSVTTKLVLSLILCLNTPSLSFAQTTGIPDPAPKNFNLGFGTIGGEGDDRQPMLVRRYPWSAIGRVEIVGVGHCTGSLVSRDVIVTNAHCIFDDAGNRLDITIVKVALIFPREGYDIHLEQASRGKIVIKIGPSFNLISLLGIPMVG